MSAQVEADSTAPPDLVRFHLLSGIVEAWSGSPESAERHFQAALITSQNKLPRQPADRVEIYLRLAQLLNLAHREQEAADVAQQGLRCAESSYGAFFAGHPLVAELRNVAASAALVSR